LLSPRDFLTDERLSNERISLGFSAVIPAKAGIHVCDSSSMLFIDVFIDDVYKTLLRAGATGLSGVCPAAWTSAPLPQAGARIRSRSNAP
jgi:hypothetical protein